MKRLPPPNNPPIGAEWDQAAFARACRRLIPAALQAAWRILQSPLSSDSARLRAAEIIRDGAYGRPYVAEAPTVEIDDDVPRERGRGLKGMLDALEEIDRRRKREAQAAERRGDPAPADESQGSGAAVAPVGIEHSGGDRD